MGSVNPVQPWRVDLTLPFFSQRLNKHDIIRYLLSSAGAGSSIFCSLDRTVLAISFIFSE